jgi:hypothetical protein
VMEWSPFHQLGLQSTLVGYLTWWPSSRGCPYGYVLLALLFQVCCSRPQIVLAFSPAHSMECVSRTWCI